MVCILDVNLLKPVCGFTIWNPFRLYCLFPLSSVKGNEFLFEKMSLYLNHISVEIISKWFIDSCPFNLVGLYFFVISIIMGIYTIIDFLEKLSLLYQDKEIHLQRMMNFLIPLLYLFECQVFQKCAQENNKHYYFGNIQ